MTPSPSRRILNAWQRCHASGYALTACNFLVLCDVMESRDEPISCARRAQRLHISQPSVSDALHTAAHFGLVTLVTSPLPASAQKSSLSALPTPLACKIFSIRPPKKSATKAA